MYEIYLSSDNNELVVENCDTHESVLLRSMGQDFLRKCERKIEEQYPQAWEKLVAIHSGAVEFSYARVRNFVACNFSIKDGQPDIDQDWNFVLEHVPCPARISGICKGGICSPTISTLISDREKEVLSLFVKGFDEQEIADTLFVSKHTIHNHINNMYEKIGVRGKSSPDRKLVAYAYAKKIV